MITLKFYRVAGWLAFLYAILTIIGIISLIVFFALVPTLGSSNIMGSINDITSILGSLVAVPVALALYLLHRAQSPGSALIGFTLALVGDLAVAVIQTLFVLRLVSYDATLAVAPLGFAVAGVGVIIFGSLALQHQTLSSRLARLMIIAGVASIVLVVVGMMTGWDSPLTSLSGLMFVVFGVAWNIGFGQTLLNRSYQAPNPIT